MSDSKERFTNRVDAYVKARPTYPRQILDRLTSEIGFTCEWTIADIGAGTGISTRLFLENGNTVYAVEPNAAMRRAAEQSLAGFANHKSINASAEATTLPDHSIDLIVAAQAFHWFNIEKTRREFQRILRSTGWALLMWNNRKLTGTPFLQAYENLLETFGTDYHKVRHVNIDAPALTCFFGHPTYRTIKFPNQQRLDYEGFRARILSSSYMPQDNPKMIAELRQIFDRYNVANQVTIEYETELFLAQLA